MIMISSEIIQKNSLEPETKREIPDATNGTTTINPLDRLKNEIENEIKNEDIVFESVNQGGYSIKYKKRYRIARVEKQVSQYLCTCNRKESRLIFDKIQDDYSGCQGFDYKASGKGTSKEARIVHFERYNDMKDFLLTVIREYLS